MSFYLQQSRTAKGQEECKPVNKNGDKPLRKIYRLKDWADSNKVAIYFKNLPRFGPSYGSDNKAIKRYKEEAWNQVKNMIPDEESTVYGDYLESIKGIENEAKETYDSHIVERLMPSNFQMMMIEDGCYFLQLALYILGGAELLGYAKNHPDFGTTDPEAKISRWIKAMYFIGNQIPYVVIRKLMKQRFFQNVIKEGIKKQTWDPPSDLPKMVLYLLVVEPELERNGRSSSWLLSKLKRQEAAPYFRETPSDLLHGLHCLVLGPGSDPLDWEAFDLEAGTKDLDQRFPSATEVEQVGVTLEKAKHGIREIKFRKKYFLFPRLYVPPFTFGADTELMLQYLKRYEIEQQIRKSKCEVTAYLRFMSDLIQTMKDVNILISRGIIQVKKDVKKDNELPAMLENPPAMLDNPPAMLDNLLAMLDNPPAMLDNLPAMLNNLGSSEKTLTQYLRLTRLQIVNYSTTTRNLLSLAAVAFFLAVVQTVFTILAYFYPRN